MGLATETMPPVNETLVTVPVVKVAHVPSPRRYVDADGVPVTGLAANWVADEITLLFVVPAGNVTLVAAVTV